MYLNLKSVVLFLKISICLLLCRPFGNIRIILETGQPKYSDKKPIAESVIQEHTSPRTPHGAVTKLLLQYLWPASAPASTSVDYLLWKCAASVTDF